MAISYQYTADGFFVGQCEDHGFPPNNSTYSKPADKKGFVPRWNGTRWVQVENHKGEQGFLDGVPHVVNEYGPYPAGWSATAPEPTETEKNEQERQRILAELNRLDAKSCRPARAVSLAYAAGKTPDEADVMKLAEIEAEAKALRQELAKLNG